MRTLDELFVGLIGYFLIERLVRCTSHTILRQPTDDEMRRCWVELGLLGVAFAIFLVQMK